MDSFEVCVVYGDDIDISPDILATAPISSRWAPDWDWEEVLKAQLLSCISSLHFITSSDIRYLILTETLAQLYR